MVYETGCMTKKTTFLPWLLGVELVVIGFEPVGFGFELVVIGIQLVGVGLLWSRLLPHPVEFCHYYQ